MVQNKGIVMYIFPEEKIKKVSEWFVGHRKTEPVYTGQKAEDLLKDDETIIQAEEKLIKECKIIGITVNLHRDSADVIDEVKIIYSSYNVGDFEGYGGTLTIAKLDAMYNYLEIEK
jgi:hypothetical protein